VDVTSEEQVDSSLAQAVAAFGYIDIPISNAGIRIVHPVEEFSFIEWFPTNALTGQSIVVSHEWFMQYDDARSAIGARMRARHHG
jgi:NAD(P)-dependent dehydrogenase (short-subunit alcohol dehydrogenase family)